jgi:hypothetical protein
MPENRARNYVFPLFLILVGVALFMEQLGKWHLNWLNVLRLWPLLLVLIGLQIILRNVRWGGIVSLILTVALMALIVVFALTGSREDALSGQTLNYPIAGIKSAIVRMDVGVGQLEITPLRSAGNLYEARIDYDSERTTLLHDVQVAGNEANVHLKSSQAGGGIFGWNADEAWRVALSPDVSIRLDIHTGVNRADIDLTSLKLSRLGLDVGVGQTQVVLSGEGSYRATINGGVGSLVVEIPQGTEARIRLNTGVGAVKVDDRFIHEGKYYTSEGYERAKEKLDIDISGGVGSITIR